MKSNPEGRAEFLEAERRRAKKKIAGTAKRKGKRRAPGELEFKQDMMIILKVAGYTHQQIGASIGEHKDTINEWFKSPDIAAKYLKVTKTLTDSARRLLETFTIEAIQSIVDIMRDTPDDKIRLDAAKEILDRGGLPKASRTETKTEATTTFGVDDEQMAALRELPPDLQEEAAQMMEEVAAFLVESTAKPGKDKDA